PTRISDMIPIWQSQLNEVAKAWGGNYKCNIHEGGTGDYQMIFTTTNSVSGCGPACHTVSDNGQPVGLVNPSEGIASGNDPLLEAAHEIDELCVDPTVDHTIENKLVEIVDPVVCWTYCEGQEIVPGKPEQDCTGDNRVPDFVFPSYYDPNGKPPYDFMNLLTKPGSHC